MWISVPRMTRASRCTVMGVDFAMPLRTSSCKAFLDDPTHVKFNENTTNQVAAAPTARWILLSQKPLPIRQERQAAPQVRLLESRFVLDASAALMGLDALEFWVGSSGLATVPRRSFRFATEVLHAQDRICLSRSTISAASNGQPVRTVCSALAQLTGNQDCLLGSVL